MRSMFSGSSGVNYSNGAITADTSEIRGFFTANKGLSVSSAEFNIDSANVRGMFSGSTGVTYNSGTGAIAIGQAVSTSSNVTFGTLASGAHTITNATNAGGTARNVYQSTSAPTGGAGAVGDLWILYS